MSTMHSMRSNPNHRYGKKKGSGDEGFIKVYIFFLCLIFLIIAAAYYVGKKFPSNEIVINDPVASRYEIAGVDLNENPSLYPDRPIDPNADSYENQYVNTYPRNNPRDTDNASSDLGSSQNSGQNPAQNSQQSIASAPIAPAHTASSSMLTFTSKVNDRISFAYPADMKVREEQRGVANAQGQGGAIVFTLTNTEGKTITATYEKTQSGCFDPLRSFAIDPSSGTDYRILYPQKVFFIEEKYQALRNDEETGRYVFAGTDPTRPFVLTSNVCAQTAVPTRLRITSTQFTAADKAYLMGVHDAILSKITL